MVGPFLCEKIVTRKLEGRAAEEEVIEEEAATIEEIETGDTIDTAMIEGDQGEVVIEMMIEDITIEVEEMIAIDIMMREITTIEEEEDLEVVETMMTGMMEEDMAHMAKESILAGEMTVDLTHLLSTAVVRLDHLCPQCQEECTDKEDLEQTVHQQ